MSHYLLDTNVISELRRRAPDAGVMAWIRSVDAAELHLSVLTFGEIARGIEKLAPRDRPAAARLQSWLDGLLAHFRDRVIEIDAEIALAWGRIAAARTVPVVDGLLAATASVRGLTLVTRNERDVGDLGVPLLNPWRNAARR